MRSRENSGQKFKSGVVTELIRAMQPEMAYSPDDGISSDLFRGTQLFSTYPDRYSTEDRMAGRIGDTDVIIAEVHAEERRTRTDSKGRTKTYYVTIFKGILMVADFHKNFRGVTRVLPDNEDSIFGKMGTAMKGFLPFESKEAVRMEDPDFENHFQVYSTDHVEAHYILSTSMRRRILELRQFWDDAAVSLSFVESMVNLAIPYKGNLLEPEAKKSLKNNQQLLRVVEELRSCFQLVEDLNLNTRIWDKE